MSGRTLHLRDGELITNRKTDRRQSAPRPLLVRLHEMNDRQARCSPSTFERDVRVAFLLPKTLQGFVASGRHGIGVNVLKGFVQITSYSAEQCFEQAREFFATVAKERPGFTITASIISTAHPDQHYGRHLTVVRGAMVVSGGIIEPRVYEARAA